MITVSKELAVSEVFYSLQGEGVTMGVPSVFLRLKSCNLLCGGQGTVQDKKLHDGAAWRCDTIEVWLKGLWTIYENVLNDWFIRKLRNGAHLIITGGEPLLQQDQIIDYLVWFRETQGFMPYVEIETNGTIMPKFSPTRWNCSPKLESSGVPKEKRYKPEVLSKLNEHEGTIFKFVVTSSIDWLEIIASYLNPLIIDKPKIWLMPGASNIEELLENNKFVSSLALGNQVNFCSRLQIEIWNKTVGV